MAPPPSSRPLVARAASADLNTGSIILLAVGGACLLLTVVLGTVAGVYYLKWRKRRRVELEETERVKAEVQRLSQMVAQGHAGAVTQPSMLRPQRHQSSDLTPKASEAFYQGSGRSTSDSRQPTGYFESGRYLPEIENVQEMTQETESRRSGELTPAMQIAHLSRSSKDNRIRSSRQDSADSNALQRITPPRRRRASQVAQGDVTNVQRNDARRARVPAASEKSSSEDEMVDVPPRAQAQRRGRQASHPQVGIDDAVPVGAATPLQVASGSDSIYSFATADGGSDKAKTNESPAITFGSPGFASGDTEYDSPYIRQMPMAQASKGQQQQQVQQPQAKQASQPPQWQSMAGPASRSSILQDSLRAYTPPTPTGYSPAIPARRKGSSDPRSAALAAILTGLGDLPEERESRTSSSRESQHETSEEDAVGLGIGAAQPRSFYTASNLAAGQSADVKGRQDSAQSNVMSDDARGSASVYSTSSSRAQIGTPSGSSMRRGQAPSRYGNEVTASRLTRDALVDGQSHSSAQGVLVDDQDRETYASSSASKPSLERRLSSQFSIRRKPVSETGADGTGIEDDVATRGGNVTTSAAPTFTTPFQIGTMVGVSPFSKAIFLQEDPAPPLPFNNGQAMGSRASLLRAEAPILERTRASSPTLAATVPQAVREQREVASPNSDTQYSEGRTPLATTVPLPGSEDRSTPMSAQRSLPQQSGLGMPQRDMSQSSSLLNTSTSYGPPLETWNVSTQNPDAADPSFVQTSQTESGDSSEDYSVVSTTRASRGSEAPDISVVATPSLATDTGDDRRQDVISDAMSLLEEPGAADHGEITADAERSVAGNDTVESSELEGSHHRRSDISARLRMATQQALSKAPSQQGYFRKQGEKGEGTAPVESQYSETHEPMTPGMIDLSSNALALHESLRTDTPSEGSIATSEEPSGDLDTSMMDDMLQELTNDHDRSQLERSKRDSQILSNRSSQITEKRISEVPTERTLPSSRFTEDNERFSAFANTLGLSPRSTRTFGSEARPDSIVARQAVDMSTVPSRDRSSFQSARSTVPGLLQSRHKRETSQSTIASQTSPDMGISRRSSFNNVDNGAARVYGGLGYNGAAPKPLSPTSSPVKGVTRDAARPSPAMQGRSLGYPTPPLTPYEISKGLSSGKSAKLVLNTPLLQSAIPEVDDQETPRASNLSRAQQQDDLIHKQEEETETVYTQRQDLGSTQAQPSQPSQPASGAPAPTESRPSRFGSSLLFQPVSFGYKASDVTAAPAAVASTFMNYFTGSGAGAQTSEEALHEALSATHPPGSLAYIEQQELRRSVIARHQQQLGQQPSAPQRQSTASAPASRRTAREEQEARRAQMDFYNLRRGADRQPSAKAPIQTPYSMARATHMPGEEQAARPYMTRAPSSKRETRLAAASSIIYGSDLMDMGPRDKGKSPERPRAAAMQQQGSQTRYEAQAMNPFAATAAPAKQQDPDSIVPLATSAPPRNDMPSPKEIAGPSRSVDPRSSKLQSRLAAAVASAASPPAASQGWNEEPARPTHNRALSSQREMGLVAASSIISGADLTNLGARDKGKSPERPRAPIATSPSAQESETPQWAVWPHPSASPPKPVPSQAQPARPSNKRAAGSQREDRLAAASSIIYGADLSDLNSRNKDGLAEQSSSAQQQPQNTFPGSQYQMPGYGQPGPSRLHGMPPTSSQYTTSGVGSISPGSAYPATMTAGQMSGPLDASTYPSHSRLQPPRVPAPPSIMSTTSSKSRLELMGFPDPGMPERPANYTQPALDTDRSLQRMLRAGKAPRRKP